MAATPMSFGTLKLNAGQESLWYDEVAATPMSFGTLKLPARRVRRQPAPSGGNAHVLRDTETLEVGLHRHIIVQWRQRPCPSGH